MRLLFPVLVAGAAVAAPAQSQALHKCRNEAGKVTYTSHACKDLKLTEAGGVSGRVSVTPAVSQNYSVFEKPAPRTIPVRLTEQAEIKKPAK